MGHLDALLVVLDLIHIGSPLLLKIHTHMGPPTFAYGMTHLEVPMLMPNSMYLGILTFMQSFA